MNSEANTRSSVNSSSGKCPKCHGTGYLIEQMSNEETRNAYQDDRKVDYMVKCPNCNGGHDQRVQEARERSNIPSAFYDADLSKFKWDVYQYDDGRQVDTSVQRRIVEAFVDQHEKWEKRGVGLYIHSQMKGSGKTFLASCVCNSLIKKYPMNTKFVSVSELINIQKNGFNVGSVYENDPIGLLKNCKLLVLDDLGQKQTGENWTNDILFQILDNRMQNRLLTIVTSNIPIQALQMDDRIVDRIHKICYPVPLPEYCVRAREAKQNQVELFKELGLIPGNRVKT